MPPVPNTHLGPYSVTRELGRGGMGVVYLARDTRLDRDVAIKALPADFAGDAGRLSRFQREAKVLASLNHPGVASIYGLEQVGSEHYLVLEYVEGETLAARLTQGPLPIDEALGIAKQIAEAVEAAHEKGIVHRDLKPGNVMIREDGAVKVLDFGLARAGDDSQSPSRSVFHPDSPTVTSPAMPVNSPTIAGAIMGTAGYMSPEQARGKTVDKRSDIFSFGCVLFEMLTGAQPFAGETVTDSLGATLHKEADLSLLPPGTPTRIREMLVSCLAKDRRNRLHDIGDARLAIEQAAHDEPARAQVARRAPWREAIAWIAALIGVGTFIGALVMRPAAPTAPNDPVIRFTVTAPPGTRVNPESVNAVLSPDGRRLAFLASEPGGRDRVWVRDFDKSASRVLEGTDGAAMPFWSPDSRAIAYFADGALCRVPIDGGPVQRIADAPGGRGGAWSEAGIILFAPLANGPLYTVPQAGGDASPATELDPKIGETGHRFPQFLPGGRKFLYASLAPRPDRRWEEHTMLASLDSKEVREVCVGDSRATFVEGGWLLYDRAGMVYARPFDPATGAPSSDELETGILQGGRNNFGGRFGVSASGTGMIACPIDGLQRSVCEQFGIDGRIIRTITTKPENFDDPIVSPDGRSMLLRASPIWNRSELRSYDLTREGVWSRPVNDPLILNCAWSLDSAWVYYTTDRGTGTIFRCAASGGGEPELIHDTGSLWGEVKTVSRDGRFVLYYIMDPKNGRDMWLFDTESKSARPFAAGQSNEYDARLSPDGRLLAIAIDESGRPELYVQEFPESKGRVRVSLGGIATFDAGLPTSGTIQWSADGSRLMFLDADRRTIRSAAIAREPAMKVAAPETLMQLPADLSAVDIAPDGQSAYVLTRAEGQAECSISVTLNWKSGLQHAAKTETPR